MKHLKDITFFICISLWGHAALAETKMCIHSYYISGLSAYQTSISGHASVSIEQDGVTTNKWGYYPKGLMKNFMGDGELKPGIVRRTEESLKKENPALDPKVLQKKHCKAINPAEVERARSLAEGYNARFGDWSKLANNCVAFAKYMYTQVTKDALEIPLPQPKMLYTLLEKASEQKADDLANVELFEPQQAPVLQ